MFEINKKTLRNIFIGVITCILLYWILHEVDSVKSTLAIITDIISPFIFGAGLAFVLNAPMRAFEKMLKFIKNNVFRRLIALLLTLVCVVLVFVGLFWLLIPQLIETVKSLVPTLYDFFVNAEAKFVSFMEDNPNVMDWIRSNPGFKNIDWAGIAQDVGDSISKILTGAISALGDIAKAMFEFVISLVFAVYCLFQKETLSRQGRKLLYAFLPEKLSDNIIRILRLTNTTFSNFLSGQCLEVCILGCLFAVCMSIFGMPYVALISVLVAVTAFIPVVGAWVGCAFGAFLILVADPILAVWFIIMFVILQQIENNMIYPRVVGTSIGLSGMWVLVAVAIGGELMGVAGMFLMIPVASVLYTLLSEATNTRLAKKNINAEKLLDQPPELRKHMKMSFNFLKKKKK